MADPTTLDEAYSRYKTGKTFGRGDLFGFVVKDMNEFRQRLGAVDEAAVKALEERIAALETVIGRALQPTDMTDAFPPRRGPGRPPKMTVENANG